MIMCDCKRHFLVHVPVTPRSTKSTCCPCLFASYFAAHMWGLCIFLLLCPEPMSCQLEELVHSVEVWYTCMATLRCNNNEMYSF